jgi:hypothetical protein
MPMEQAKLLSLTGVLTLVIWITADSLVNETVSVPVRFELLPPASAPGMIVEPGPQAGTHQLMIAAPRKLADQIQAAAPLTIRLNIQEQPAGPATITVKELLRDQWREFPKASIIDVQPSTTDAMIDRMVSTEVNLTFQRPTLNYESAPQINPPTVKVTLRQGQLNKIALNGRLAQIDLSTAAEQLLRDQPTGNRVSVLLALDAHPYGRGASIEPSTVEVTAALTIQRTTAKVDTVPILVGTSFASFNKEFKAVVRDGSELVTRSIMVTGPTDAVARLVRGDTRAYGVIQLKEQHFADLDVFKPFSPDFRLPDGIKLAEEPQPIEMKLVQRSP